jgi:HSP20 family protein
MFGNLRDLDRMFGTMDLIQERLDRLFNESSSSYGYSPLWAVSDTFPKTNLYDKGEFFEILAEIPGFSKDDLNIKIQGNYLEMRGDGKDDTPDGYSTHRTERGVTNFSRSFTLPADVDANRVEAALKNGIMTLRLPKTEAARPKQIEIK